jgi:hypothetical protein
MASISPAQIASFETFTIDSKLREQVFPGSARSSIESSRSTQESESKRYKFKFPWF